MPDIPLLNETTYSVCANRTQAKNNFNFKVSHNFLAKVVSRYIEINYEKSQNANFLVLIRSSILLA